MKTPAKFIIGSGIIVLALCALAYVGFTESKTYYHTIAELSGLKGAARGQRMRVAGDVQAGSIQRLPGRVDFLLVEQGITLPVSYAGPDPLPDTFKDGAQTLVEGRLMPDGRFVAEVVQAKCASKYEATPGQIAPSGTSPGEPSSKT